MVELFAVVRAFESIISSLSLCRCPFHAHFTGKGLVLKAACSLAEECCLEKLLVACSFMSHIFQNNAQLMLTTLLDEYSLYLCEATFQSSFETHMYTGLDLQGCGSLRSCYSKRILFVNIFLQCEYILNGIALTRS